MNEYYTSWPVSAWGGSSLVTFNTKEKWKKEINS